MPDKLTLNVINKVLFKVALSTAERPVPATAMYNTIHFSSTHSAESKQIPNSVSIKIENNEMGRACSSDGKGRGVNRVLVVKPEGKRPMGRPRRRWEDNIKMDHQEVGGGGMDWIKLAQDRNRWPALVNAVMNLRVP
jgi:hypothetical protein